MTVVNDVRNLDNILTPDEINFFRTNVPRFLDYLKLQQTLISQLVIRVGGSGPGTGVADLSALTTRVTEAESDIVELDELADPSSQALFHAEHALNEAQAAIIMASDHNLVAQVAELRSRIEAIEFYAGDVHLIAQISDLRSRIEALENVSNP